MARDQMSLKDGLDLVRSRRTIAQPNPGFILQLKLYEKELLGSVSDVPVVLNSNRPSQFAKDIPQTNEDDRVVPENSSQFIQSEVKEV